MRPLRPHVYAIGLGSALTAMTLTGCQLPPAAAGGSTGTGDTVTAIGFHRAGDVEWHRVSCGSGGVDEYRVRVSAAVADSLEYGDPCPAGLREPMATEKYPEIYEAMTEPLPYGGGNINTCGEWQTVDKAEARQLAKECPPLKWGDLE